eukprot:1978689-Prymnesium_polylepis.1
MSVVRPSLGGELQPSSATTSSVRCPSRLISISDQRIAQTWLHAAQPLEKMGRRRHGACVDGLRGRGTRTWHACETPVCNPARIRKLWMKEQRLPE